MSGDEKEKVRFDPIRSGKAEPTLQGERKDRFVVYYRGGRERKKEDGAEFRFLPARTEEEGCFSGGNGKKTSRRETRFQKKGKEGRTSSISAGIALFRTGGGTSGGGGIRRPSK